LPGAALAAFLAAAHARPPHPTASTPLPQDVGPMALARGSAPITATVALKLRNADALQSFPTCR